MLVRGEWQHRPPRPLFRCVFFSARSPCDGMSVSPSHDMSLPSHMPCLSWLEEVARQSPKSWPNPQSVERYVEGKTELRGHSKDSCQSSRPVRYSSRRFRHILSKSFEGSQHNGTPHNQPQRHLIRACTCMESSLFLTNHVPFFVHHQETRSPSWVTWARRPVCWASPSWTAVSRPPPGKSFSTTRETSRLTRSSLVREGCQRRCGVPCRHLCCFVLVGLAIMYVSFRCFSCLCTSLSGGRECFHMLYSQGHAGDSSVHCCACPRTARRP